MIDIEIDTSTEHFIKQLVCITVYNKITTIDFKLRSNKKMKRMLTSNYAIGTLSSSIMALYFLEFRQKIGERSFYPYRSLSGKVTFLLNQFANSIN